MESDLITDGGHIRQIMQKICGVYGKDELWLEVCTVDEVDMSSQAGQWTLSATPESGENITQITNVQFTASIASNGQILVPKVGSNIIVAFTLRNQYYVWLASDFEMYGLYWDSGSGMVSYTINENGNGIQKFNDGSYGGLIIGSGNNGTNLIDQINKLNAQVQAIMGLLINNAYASLQSASAAALPPTSAPINPVPNPSFDNLLNTNITHGKPS